MDFGDAKSIGENSKSPVSDVNNDMDTPSPHMTTPKDANESATGHNAATVNAAESVTTEGVPTIGKSTSADAVPDSSILTTTNASGVEPKRKDLTLEQDAVLSPGQVSPSFGGVPGDQTNQGQTRKRKYSDTTDSQATTTLGARRRKVADGQDDDLPTYDQLLEENSFLKRNAAVNAVGMQVYKTAADLALDNIVQASNFLKTENANLKATAADVSTVSCQMVEARNKSVEFQQELFLTSEVNMQLLMNRLSTRFLGQPMFHTTSDSQPSSSIDNQAGRLGVGVTPIFPATVKNVAELRSTIFGFNATKMVENESISHSPASLDRHDSAHDETKAPKHESHLETHTPPSNASAEIAVQTKILPVGPSVCPDPFLTSIGSTTKVTNSSPTTIVADSAKSSFSKPTDVKCPKLSVSDSHAATTVVGSAKTSFFKPSRAKSPDLPISEETEEGNLGEESGIESNDGDADGDAAMGGDAAFDTPDYSVKLYEVGYNEYAMTVKDAFVDQEDRDNYFCIDVAEEFEKLKNIGGQDYGQRRKFVGELEKIDSNTRVRPNKFLLPTLINNARQIYLLEASEWTCPPNKPNRNTDSKIRGALKYFLCKMFETNRPIEIATYDLCLHSLNRTIFFMENFPSKHPSVADQFVTLKLSPWFESAVRWALNLGIAYRPRKMEKCISALLRDFKKNVLPKYKHCTEPDPDAMMSPRLQALPNNLDRDDVSPLEYHPQQKKYIILTVDAFNKSGRTDYDDMLTKRRAALLKPAIQKKRHGKVNDDEQTLETAGPSKEVDAVDTTSRVSMDRKAKAKSSGTKEHVRRQKHKKNKRKKAKKSNSKESIPSKEIKLEKDLPKPVKKPFEPLSVTALTKMRKEELIQYNVRLAASLVESTSADSSKVQKSFPPSSSSKQIKTIKVEQKKSEKKVKPGDKKEQDLETKEKDTKLHSSKADELNKVVDPEEESSTDSSDDSSNESDDDDASNDSDQRE